MTHNNALGGMAATFQNAVNALAWGSDDRQASARFPTGKPSYDNYAACDPDTHSSNI